MNQLSRKTLDRAALASLSCLPLRHQVKSLIPGKRQGMLVLRVERARQDPSSPRQLKVMVISIHSERAILTTHPPFPDRDLPLQHHSSALQLGAPRIPAPSPTALATPPLISTPLRHAKLPLPWLIQALMAEWMYRRKQNPRWVPYEAPLRVGTKVEGS